MGKVFFLDIDGKELRRYAVEAKGNNYAIKEQRNFPLTDSGDLPVDAVSERMETAYLSLPLGSLNFRVIDLPFSDKERILQVLPFELEGMILGGAEAVIFDAVVLGRHDNAFQILAVYLEKKSLGAMLEKLKRHGIDPVCITSLELRHALNGFSPSKLVPPASISDEERPNLVVEEVRSPTIQLRRNEYSFTRDREKTKKSLKITVILFSLILAMLSADMLMRLFYLKQEAAVLRNEMRKSYLELFPGEKNIINELHQLKSHIREMRGREEIIGGVRPLEVFSELARIEREGVRLYEVNIERDKLAFRGEAPSLSSVQQLQEKLKRYFDEVSVSDSKASAQGATIFTITAKERKTS